MFDNPNRHILDNETMIMSARGDRETMTMIMSSWQGKLNLFNVWVDVTLKDLKDQLDQINQRLNHRDTRRMEDVGHQRPSIKSVRRLQFSRICSRTTTT